MKAPDKIYLAESDKIKGEVSSNFASDIPFKTHTSIEYIRKEALLEWAKQCFRLQDGGSWYSKGAADAFSKVIDKLNEM